MGWIGRMDLKDEIGHPIERAVRAVLAEGYRTADIYEEGSRKVGTKEMGDAVISAMMKQAA